VKLNKKFQSLENIFLVLNSSVQGLFNELSYSLSKKDISELDITEKVKIIDSSYERILFKLEDWIIELTTSKKLSFSDNDELSKYIDKVSDDVETWLNDFYAALLEFFKLDYDQNDQKMIYSDVCFINDKLRNALKDRIKLKQSNVIQFPTNKNTNKPPIEKFLSNNSNCSIIEKGKLYEVLYDTEEVNLNPDVNFDSSVEACKLKENYFTEQAKSLIKNTNEFGYVFWQEKPFDLVIEANIKSWIDSLYFDQFDPGNKKIFKHIKEYFLNKNRSNKNGL